MRRTSMFICSFLAFWASASAADWPRFRGPDANGFSKETGINKDWNNKKPELVWKVSLGDNGYAGPSVADGKVFILDHKGANDVVRAFDLATGKQVWEFSYPDTAKDVHGFSRATPAFDNGKLYTFSRNGVLNCLNAADGTKVWSRDLVADLKAVPPMWLMAVSPVIDGDNVIVQAGGAQATIVVLDKATGKIIWNAGNGDATGYATVTIATIGGKKQYLVLTGQHLVSYDPDARKELWSVPFSNERKINGAMPVVIGDTVFLTSNYNIGSALVKVADGKAEIAWQNNDLRGRFNTPLLNDGCIYGIGEGFMVCVDPKAGKTMWKQPKFDSGGLIGIDGVIIAMDGKEGDAVMVQFSPEAYKEMGRFKPLGGQSWTPPIVADGKLIVRNTKEMACFNLK